MSSFILSAELKVEEENWDLQLPPPYSGREVTSSGWSAKMGLSLQGSKIREAGGRR